MKHNGIENIGVSWIEYIVRSQLNWIFRAQAVDDKGVDAHVEVCVNGRALGRLIGMQIKTGESYFQEPTENGWVFRDTLDHLDYYLKHSLPIVVVLCDHVKREAFWQAVTVENIEKTGRGWKLEIPSENVLGKASRPGLRSLSLPTPGMWSAIDELRTSIVDRGKDGPRGNYEQVSSGERKSFPYFLLRSLVTARQSVYFVVHHLSRETLFVMEAISAAVQVKGVIAIADKDLVRDLRRAQEEAPSLDIRIGNSQRPFRPHAKFVVIDGMLTVFSSGNLDVRARRSSVEVTEASDREQIVRGYLDSFWGIWNEVGRDS